MQHISAIVLKSKIRPYWSSECLLIVYIGILCFLIDFCTQLNPPVSAYVPTYILQDVLKKKIDLIIVCFFSFS